MRIAGQLCVVRSDVDCALWTNSQKKRDFPFLVFDVFSYTVLSSMKYLRTVNILANEILHNHTSLKQQQSYEYNILQIVFNQLERYRTSTRGTHLRLNPSPLRSYQSSTQQLIFENFKLWFLMDIERML